MNKIKLYSAMFFALSLLPLYTGCATLTRGTTESYGVVSDPPGALVTLSTGETCTTPCFIDKKRNESFLVTIEKTGYEPHQTQVNYKTCDGGRLCMIGNFLMVGSIVWASIDSLSGATQSLTPNPCETKLVPAVLPAAIAQPLPPTTKDSQG